MSAKELVFMDHDGGIDDLLSLLLLLTMEDKELIGVSVTPADCYIEPALESTYKILQLFGKENIELGRGDYNGANAFPAEWRARPGIANALPILINLPAAPDPYEYREATELLTSKLMEATQQVTIIMTGPCSNLVRAIKKEQQIKQKIKEVVWMGGAFNTRGNVQTFQHNGSAEWNVFWDPASAKELFKMELPLTCIPLDVTDHVPVTKEFLSKLAAHSSSKLSNLAGQLWALTMDTIPSYYYTYFMWDILATSYLAIPHQFTVEQIKATVIDRPPNAGQTLPDASGYKVSIATDVNKEAFYNYLLAQLNKD
jgi:purine nucleosidase